MPQFQFHDGFAPTFIKPDLANTLESLRMGTQRICESVNSMRTFSRLDESHCKQVNLVEGLESSLVMMQSQHDKNSSALQANKIEIVRDYSTLPLIECDHGAVNQVFPHILTNAADARAYEEKAESTPKSPQSRVSAMQLDEQWIQIAIADNGPRINNNLRHIFDPFFTTKPVGKGIGPGLSISHQIIIEQHKGRLQCHSKLGKGKEFTIISPIRRVAREQQH